MAKQKHDPGVIKSKKNQKKLPKDLLWKERRKRALPRLYPGWDEDKYPLSVVKAELKRRMMSEAERHTSS